MELLVFVCEHGDKSSSFKVNYGSVVAFVIVPKIQELIQGMESQERRFPNVPEKKLLYVDLSSYNICRWVDKFGMCIQKLGGDWLKFGHSFNIGKVVGNSVSKTRRGFGIIFTCKSISCFNMQIYGKYIVDE